MSDDVLRPRASIRLALIVGSGLASCLVHAQESAAPAAADPHAAHHHMMANNDVKRSVASYDVPHLTLVRDDGASVSLDKELNDGRPVVLTFIFTSCTTICPMTSQVLSMLQRKLDDERGKVHLVSISIDPEQDTPARLRAYAERFRAGTSLAALHRHPAGEYSGAAGLRRLPGRQDDAYPGNTGARHARQSMGALRWFRLRRRPAGRIAGPRWRPRASLATDIQGRVQSRLCAGHVA